LGGQIKHEVDKANIEEMRNPYKFWLKDLNGIKHLGDLGIAVRTIVNKT
jgi:hypothetical protein